MAAHSPDMGEGTSPGKPSSCRLVALAPLHDDLMLNMSCPETRRVAVTLHPAPHLRVAPWGHRSHAGTHLQAAPGGAVCRAAGGASPGLTSSSTSARFWALQL